jgi:hypothetical protein
MLSPLVMKGLKAGSGAAQFPDFPKTPGIFPERQIAGASG